MENAKTKNEQETGIINLLIIKLDSTLIIPIMLIKFDTIKYRDMRNVMSLELKYIARSNKYIKRTFFF